MTRPRIPLSSLMLAVAIVGVDVALLRALRRSWLTVEVDGVSADNIDPIALALGVLPLGSILVYLAWTRLTQLFRHGGEATFFAGFQVFGWTAVSLCLAALTLDHGRVMDMLEASYRPVEPLDMAVDRYLSKAPSVQSLGGLVIGDGYVATVLGLPQLLFALLGGWLLRRAGIVVRVERRPSPAPGSTVLPRAVPPG